MTPDQLKAVLEAIHEHGVLELASWIAIIVTAIAAVATASAAAFALIYASRQIGTAQSGTKAMFLVDLDHRWEGNEIKEGRAKWLKMREAMIKIVDEKYPNYTAERKRQQRTVECSSYLHTLRSTEPHEYNDIISILGFFETIGYIADKGYVTADEIVDLFGESIREFDFLCWDHIQKRIEESTQEAGVPTKLWEHACNLIVYTRKVYGLKD